MIYHYCKQDVFIKILSTQHIWLSDITKMNDPNEYKTGFEIIKELAKEHFATNSEILLYFDAQNINYNFKILAVCFSSKGDMLSQWRAYACDGQGFSIGFDEHKLVQHNLFNRYIEKFNPVLSKIHLHKVQYKKDIFKKEIIKLIDLFNSKNEIYDYKILAHLMMDVASTYKDEFYECEDEVRGIITIANVNYDDYLIMSRTTDYGVSEYHSLKTNFYSISAIGEIIIGPKCNSTIEEVENELTKNNINGVKVIKSSGAYR